MKMGSFFFDIIIRPLPYLSLMDRRIRLHSADLRPRLICRTIRCLCRPILRQLDPILQQGHPILRRLGPPAANYHLLPLPPLLKKAASGAFSRI